MSGLQRDGAADELPGEGRSPSVDVLALGQLLVDMVANRAGPLAEAPAFSRAPGGAAAHVAVGVARMGRRAAFVGLVGDDPFGRYVVRTLREYGVETRYIGVHPRGRTPVAFVSHSTLAVDEEDARGPAYDPQFLFYREGGADQLLSPAWVHAEVIAGARIVVGEGIALASALPRAALHTTFRYADDAGTLVAFDVNWWPTLWQYPERARDLYHAVLPMVDILKLSSQELIMLAGGVASSEPGRLEGILRAWVDRLTVGRRRPLLLALTRGPAGCTYGLWQPDRGLAVGHLAACDITVRDRTGAGDAFLAGLLVALLDRLAPLGAAARARLDLGALEIADVAAIFAWANASGALATSRQGAVAGLPVRNTVLRLIKGRHSG